MSVFTNNKMGNFIRGGQTTIHYIRMIAQVIKQFFWASLMIALMCYAAILYFITEPHERQLAFDYSMAWFHSDLFKDDATVIDFHRPDGTVVKSTAGAVVNNREVLKMLSTVRVKADKAVYYTFFIWIGLILFFIKFIYQTGQGHKEDEHIRGGLLVQMKELKKRLRQWRIENREKEGVLKFLGLSMPKSFEPAHIMIAGDPGTGKSNLLRQIFSSIRKAKKRAIIYDRSGDFVKNFYRPGIDVILNPMDQRGANWDIFLECKKEHEFFQLANSFIPEAKSNDPFWTNAARIIFSSMALKEAQKDSPSVENLINDILHLSLEELIEYCEGTEAQSIITKGGEKMAISVRGVLVTHVRALKYLNSNAGTPFSIKEWVKDDDNESWIFITSNKDIHDTIKPLITSWLDISTSSILSLEPDIDRRIFAVIDELPTLNKLPAIQNTPAESRKYGGCFILGFQNYPQLLDIYGKNGADALCGSCSTSILFRCNEPSFADWASKQLGRAEMVETTEGISYGVNEIRDGVNLGKQKHERAIVLPTELQNLPDLQGYVKLGRGFPVGYFKDKYTDMEKLQPGYLEREDTSINSFSNTHDTIDSDGTPETVKANVKQCTQQEMLVDVNKVVETEESRYLNAWNHEEHTIREAKQSLNDAWSVNTAVSLNSMPKESVRADSKKRKHSDSTQSNSSEDKPSNGTGFVRGNKSKRSSSTDNEDSSSDKPLNANASSQLEINDSEIEMD